MSQKLTELQEKRTQLFGQISKLRDEFNAAGKKWKDGEQQKAWDAVNKDYDAVMAELDAEQAAADVETRFAALEERNHQPVNPKKIGLDDAGGGRVGQRPAPGAEKTLSREELEQARCLAMDGWFRAQYGVPLTKEQANAAKRVRLDVHAKVLQFALPSLGALNSLREAYLDHQVKAGRSRPFEYNAPLTSNVGSTGGYVIPPETLLASLEVNMLAYGAVRQVCEQIVTSTGEPLAWPTVDDTSNEGRIIPENAAADDNAGTGTSGDGGPNPSFGKTIWGAHKFTSDAVLVPYELLEDSIVNLTSILGGLLGERLGRATNRKFTVGTGANEPKGIVTDSTLGVTAAAVAAIAADEVIDLEHSVDAAYRAGAGYMLHDLVLAHLRKLKGGDGHYLWQSGFNGGAPDTLNNRPYSVNNHMATLATGNKTLLFGQFSKYKVRRVGMVRIYRLQERYREKDQDGFVAFVREDGGLLNAGTAPVKHLIQA